MITPNHSKLFKELDKSRIDKVQILNTPIVEVTLSGEIDKTEFGGESAIVHYNRQKEIDRLRDENIRLKQENQELKAELGRHRRLEELRLEAQRKAINQWNQPGHKP